MRTAILKKSKTETRAVGKVNEQVYKVGIAMVGACSLAIGIWATIALVSGMVASGGPGALIANWFQAVIG